MDPTSSISPTPPDPDPLLDVTKVAAVLGCSVPRVWRLRDAGELPAAVRVGSRVRWRRAALLRWLGELQLPNQDGRTPPSEPERRSSAGEGRP